MDLDHRDEIVLIPTYNRPEHLFYCLSMIRAWEPLIKIAIFPDRGTYFDEDFTKVTDVFDDKNTSAFYVPTHKYHGNSYNTMEAFRWAYNAGFEYTYLVEDDVAVHPDFFKWHREVHDECPNIFGSMAWVFNRFAPITEDWLFQPWYYSVGTCFRKKKLELIVKHATPNYYNDMMGYIEQTFKDSPLNSPHNIHHYEQDGLIQRILDRDRSQTVSCGIAKCTHFGIFGYNRGWSRREEFFADCNSFEERVARLNNFVADPYWRVEYFGREVVEREIGKELPKRLFNYQIKVGPYETEFVSELSKTRLPRRIKSVPVTPEMEIVLTST
jgi:hypothetical protein